MRKYALILLLLLSTATYAQHSGTKKMIEAVFDRKQEHKDGFDVGGVTIEIPPDVAKRCDKKKVKLIGREVLAGKDEWVSLKDYHVVQKRGPDIYKVTAKGDTLIQTDARAVHFYLTSIEVWNELSKKWEPAYSK